MKLKPLMPSSRERKRYVAFEVVSDKKLGDANAVAKAVHQSMLAFAGELGTAKAGLIVLSDQYHAANQRGIARVTHTSVDHLKASLCFIRQISGADATVRSVAVSGNINKAKLAVRLE